MGRLNELLRRTRAQRKIEIQETTTLGAPLPALPTKLAVRGGAAGLRVAVMPDTQVRDGVPTGHLAAYGKYIAAKRPDVVVCIGDFADMPSLSTHDEPGSIHAEGLRYAADLGSVHRAMDIFMEPIAKAKGYNPVMVLTLGNHEDRINRAVAADPKQLHGRMRTTDLRYAQYGWQVFPFLQPVEIGGVVFCHYFPAGVMGRALSTAAGILRKYHQSAFAGHLQGRDIAYGKRATGESMTAIISGSFYQHDEFYLSPVTNRHWRGAYFLHEVKDGQFDEMALSLGYLMRRFA